MFRWSSITLGAVLILAAAVVTVPLAADPSFTQGEIEVRTLTTVQVSRAGLSASAEMAYRITAGAVRHLRLAVPRERSTSPPRPGE